MKARGRGKRATICRASDSNDSRLRHHGWTVAENGCWVWAGSTTGDGYGRLTINYVARTAHRVAYETWVGPIPEGLAVLHGCDNPPCINPEHLRVGTLAENSRDMVERGRVHRWSEGRRGIRLGDGNPNASLTTDIVLAARLAVADGLATIGELAARYGVANSTMSQAVRGISWSHLPQPERRP